MLWSALIFGTIAFSKKSLMIGIFCGLEEIHLKINKKKLKKKSISGFRDTIHAVGSILDA
jgi:hypothetical protein